MSGYRILCPGSTEVRADQSDGESKFLMDSTQAASLPLGFTSRIAWDDGFKCPPRRRLIWFQVCTWESASGPNPSSCNSSRVAYPDVLRLIQLCCFRQNHACQNVWILCTRFVPMVAHSWHLRRKANGNVYANTFRSLWTQWILSSSVGIGAPRFVSGSLDPKQDPTLG